MNKLIKTIIHPKPYLLILIITIPILITVLIFIIYTQPEKYLNAVKPISINPQTTDQLTIENTQFSTDVKNYTYIFTGDTGTGNKNQYQVANAIDSFCTQKNNCKYMFIAGDIIYENGVLNDSDIQFTTKFEQPYQQLQIPIYIAMGNHDYRGCSDCYLQYANNSEKWYQPGFYYKIEEDETITFYVIDTENYTQKQHLWLSEQLYYSKTKNNIVIGHRPIKSYEITKYLEKWNGEDLLKELICDQADYYISGHAHVLEDVGQLENCSVHQLVSGGGGAYFRKVVLPNDNLFTHQGYGYLTLTIDQQDNINYKFYNQHNELLHQGKK